MSADNSQGKRFAIAVSYPSEHRKYVENVVKALAEEIGRDRVFYDKWYENELVGLNGDLKLERYYRDLSELVVPFFSEHYEKKWCQIEWRLIRAMLKDRRKEDAVIPVQMDCTKVEGWEEIDIAIRRKSMTGKQLADKILLAYRAYRQRHAGTEPILAVAEDEPKTELPTPYFDCTMNNFISYLIKFDTISIIGVTNENLNKYLEKAWRIRKKGNKDPWRKIRVLFLARHHLDKIKDPADVRHGTGDDPLIMRQKSWEDGVQRVRQFLLGGEQKAQVVDIRYTDLILPFVGQLYDEKHIRIAFLLPDRDIKTSCYINMQVDRSPCQDQRHISVDPEFSEGQPPCKDQTRDRQSCETCSWKKSHSPCIAIQHSINQIFSNSTPLFAANVIGTVKARDQFHFISLSPQNNWRSFSFPESMQIKPAHLLTFILICYKDKVLLQWRTSDNSSGELNRYGVIPGKVNDEDFFEEQPDDDHRQNVYNMQMKWDKILNEKRDLNKDEWQLFNRFTNHFSDKVNLKADSVIEENTLGVVCKRAAKRTIQEKLDLEIKEDQLRPYAKSYVVNRDNHDLYIKLFRLDIELRDRLVIHGKHRANIKEFTVEEINQLLAENKLTEFLYQNISDLYSFMPKKNVLVSKCLMGHKCQYDQTAPDRIFEKQLIEHLGYNVFEVCPEELAGLPTPRIRMEIAKGDGHDVLAKKARVVTKDGKDVTDIMISGAEKALNVAKENEIQRMISRRRSPSCSGHQIFSGAFDGKLKEGVGVTVALIKSKDIEVIELETLMIKLIRETMNRILNIYKADRNWTENKKKAADFLKAYIPIEKIDPWHDVFLEAFKSTLPDLHLSDQQNGPDEISDSDTARFIQDVFRTAYGLEFGHNGRCCKICTYPEGFLDSYLLEDGTCSTCDFYHKNKGVFENRDHLQSILKTKLDEIKGKYAYDAIAACSGGKDSVYMMLQLRKKYDLNLLCVMEDLDQQNEEAIENARNAAEKLGVEYLELNPPSDTKSIRRNFLLTGNSFCRLCLRSHFIRIYEVALKKQIPLIFFGLSPYQCLDCVDAIKWSLQAINDVKTPTDQLDRDSLLKRYKHRAFQGGFEQGFVTSEEKKLLNEWMQVFTGNDCKFPPLIVPFYIFEEYPDTKKIISTITAELDWKPSKVILNRTNCKLLRPAGIMHRAIGRRHLNYKERATELRIKRDMLPPDEIRHLKSKLNSTEVVEYMTKVEFEDILKSEFNVSIDSLPDFVVRNLNEILTD